MTFEHARAADLAALERIAAALARTLGGGDVVALSGPLGAGKTAFVRALVRALHGRDPVSSPTFTFRHRYDGEPPIEHLDFFRIADPAEAVELGLEDAFEPGKLVLVEWPERVPELVPRAAVRITLAGAGEGPREVTIERP